MIHPYSKADQLRGHKKKEKAKFPRLGAGKKTREWQNAKRDELDPEYQRRGITACEIRRTVANCTGGYAIYLHYAHDHKRNHPKCSHTFQHTVLACDNCHNWMEYSKKRTEGVFNRLRPGVDHAD